MTSSAKKNTIIKEQDTGKVKKSDYSNDPFFVKKREASIKLLQKSNIPEAFKLKKM